MQNTGMLEQNVRIWYFLNLHLQNASSSEIAFWKCQLLLSVWCTYGR